MTTTNSEFGIYQFLYRLKKNLKGFKLFFFCFFEKANSCIVISVYFDLNKKKYLAEKTNNKNLRNNQGWLSAFNDQDRYQS